jgi:hypothetical protein
MVGKPNFSQDLAERTDVPGAAHATPGLPALDQEREASMADEGGASGATMESEDLRRETEDLEFEADADDPVVIDPRALLIGALAIGVLGYLAFRARA